MHSVSGSRRSSAAGGSAVVIGNFDGVHLGHQALLARTVETAVQKRSLATALTFEPHPRVFLDPAADLPRLTRFHDKITLLRETGVDRIVITRFDDRLRRRSARDFFEETLIGRLNVNDLIVGDDFLIGADRVQLDALSVMAARRGVTVTVVEGVLLDGQRISSTAIRQRLAEGQLDEAAAMLGRPYRVSGVARPGRRLGRQLGFPTINLSVGKDRLPIGGVFIVVFDWRGASYRGVANVGHRPTVDQNGNVPLMEVHSLDAFEGDPNGERLCVTFLKKLRDETRFDSLAALQSAIARDKSAAATFFGL